MLPCRFTAFSAQVTGFGGTTARERTILPAHPSERVIHVQFEAYTSPDFPWEFYPEQREVTVKVGEEKLAYFTAKNLHGQGGHGPRGV